MICKHLLLVLGVLILSISPISASLSEENSAAPKEEFPGVILLGAEELESTTRISFQCPREVSYTAFFLNNPFRLVVDFDAARGEGDFKGNRTFDQNPLIDSLAYYNLPLPNTSRIEISLRRKPLYHFKRAKDTLLLELSPSLGKKRSVEEVENLLSSKEELLEEKEREIEALKENLARLKSEESLLSKASTPPRSGVNELSLSFQEEKERLKERFDQWIKAWEGKNKKAFSSFYSPHFKGRGKNKEQWIDYKSGTFDRYEAILVNVEKLKITAIKKAIRVSFVQEFMGDSYTDRGRKILLWHKQVGEWKIFREYWKPLK